MTIPGQDAQSSQQVEFYRSSGLQILFAIHESASQYLERSKIGHVEEMEDVPGLGETFFIAASRRRLLYGPFRVTIEQYRLEKPEYFKRKREGTSEIYDAECPYIFEFEPFYETTHTNKASDLRAISWADASRLAGVPHEWWDGIRENRLDDEQLSRLVEVLLNLNKGDGIPGVVAFPYDALGMSDGAWADYIKSYYGDGAEWGEDGEPLNHAADVELRYGGDYQLAEANEPD